MPPTPRIMPFLTALTNFSMIRQHFADSLPYSLARRLSIRQTLSQYAGDDDFDNKQVFSQELPVASSYPKTTRSVFTGADWRVHCHPSTGGVLIKESANIVDLQFLSLSRSVPSNRSLDDGEEDEFCTRMRRVGASWWTSEYAFWAAREPDFFGGHRYYEPGSEERELKDAEEARARKIVEFGWRLDSVGVWVLRFAGYDDYEEMPSEYETVPRDYRLINFALDMEEKIELMKRFGATFVEDASQVEELRDELPRAPPPGDDHCRWRNNPIEGIDVD